MTRKNQQYWMFIMNYWICAVILMNQLLMKMTMILNLKIWPEFQGLFLIMNQLSQKMMLKDCFSFLTNIIEDYGSFNDAVDGVQLMTIHKAKGLEFPVTIVSSLGENKFPMLPKDPEHKKILLI